MHLNVIILFILLVHFSCKGVSQEEIVVGGPCEGCEAALESDPGSLQSVDTTVSFFDGANKIKISGIVFSQDEMAPVPGVIIYVHHTDHSGLYSPELNAEGWGRRHGKNRIWLRTDKNGKYTFYCGRPAAYPNGSEPQHIHLTIKEKGLSPYYIDSVVFDDDPLLTASEKDRLDNRGGSGIVTLKMNREILSGNRDIYLGKNIPGYPK